jgi:hypothetical protein
MDTNNFKYEPQDTEARLSAQRNADAFLQMADEINNTTSTGSSFDQPTQEIPEQRTINTKETFDRIEHAKMKNAIPNIGPKYLEALDRTLSIADIRSIEAELPVLKCKVIVSPLTGQEEQALRSASVSPASFLKKINELLFNHTKFENIEFTSFDNFLSELYPPDKSILIWALLSASYLVLPTMEKECASCGEKYLVDGNPEDLVHDDTLENIWDKPEPPATYVETQYALNGQLGFEIGMPSERTRLILSSMINPEKAKANIDKTGSLMSYADNMVFFTRAVMVGGTDERIVLTDMKQDIFPFLHNLPPKISDAVKNTMDLNIFNRYMPTFYLNTTCSSCLEKEKIIVDPEISFFRKTISL